MPKNTSITAVIPARNEAALIGRAVNSLLSQDFPGILRVVVVDDHSSDGTAAAANAAGLSERLRVVAARPLPQGWTGKLWALSEGLREAAADSPDFFLLTDADIVHSPDNVRKIAGEALSADLDLVSLMVRLR
ncbi:MAG: glycosyltransferase, partial [Bryobacteraceae bacterium]